MCLLENMAFGLIFYMNLLAKIHLGLIILLLLISGKPCQITRPLQKCALSVRDIPGKKLIRSN